MGPNKQYKYILSNDPLAAREAAFVRARWCLKLSWKKNDGNTRRQPSIKNIKCYNIHNNGGGDTWIMSLRQVDSRKMVHSKSAPREPHHFFSSITEASFNSNANYWLYVIIIFISIRKKCQISSTSTICTILPSPLLQPSSMPLISIIISCFCPFNTPSINYNEYRKPFRMLMLLRLPPRSLLRKWDVRVGGVVKMWWLLRLRPRENRKRRKRRSSKNSR